MAGVAIELELNGIPEVADRLSGLAEIEIEDLAFTIGQLIEGQTQRRIADDKTAPDGAPWASWSADYAVTRGPQHSLLRAGGDLLESVQNYTTGTDVRVGTPLIYAAVHQFGSDDGDTPARPYLGLSDGDRREIRDFVVGGLEEAIE
jgi:phage virion morphogenesis protein